MDRDEILNKVLEYAGERSTPNAKYAYAFGMLSVMISDADLKKLEKIVKN
jgi:hypothetical protein